MIAVDSSTLIAYIRNDHGTDVDLLDAALDVGNIAISPMVLAEVLSEPQLPSGHAALVQSLPLFELHEGFWLRVARTRADIISRKLRARLPDAMIAQTCIDHDIALIARDGDFRHFAKHCGLKLA